jgi:hypothetical protein
MAACRPTGCLGRVVLALSLAGALGAGGCEEGLKVQAQLALDKTVMQFEDVAVGFPAIQELTVSNTGLAGLQFLTLAPRLGAQSRFQVVGIRDPLTGGVNPQVPASLGPGGSMILLIQYDPLTEDAADFDTLDVLTNDRDPCPSEQNPCEVQLSGTGAPPDAELEVACPPEEACPGGTGAVTCRVILDAATNTHPVRLAFNFCEVPAGANRELSAQLRNIGNIPLDLSGFAFDAAFGVSDDFRLLEPGNQTVTLQPGMQTSLTLVYAPQAEGADAAGFDLDVNDTDIPNGTFSVRMLAFSAEADIDVNPEHIPFEEVTQGSSATEDISVHNTGTGTLSITGIEVTGGSLAGEFSVSPSEPFELAVAGMQVLHVTYAPQDVGADDGSVIIYSNDPDEPQVVVTLGGNVRPDLEVTPSAAVEFVNVPQGGDAEQPVTLRNVGYADLTISAIAFTQNPGDPHVFGMTGLPVDFPATPIVLAPTESTSFTITFHDNTLIEGEVGQLEIAHDSPNDSNPYILMAINSGTPANLPPVAVVNPQTLTINGLDQQVSLDGSGSFDPDAGDSVAAYGWSFLFKPTDAQGNVSQAQLDTTQDPTTTFTPDMVGTYIVRLVVWDTFNAQSQPVDAEISVNP